MIECSGGREVLGATRERERGVYRVARVCALRGGAKECV